MRSLEYRFDNAKHAKINFRPDWTSTVHCPDCGATKESGLDYQGEFGGMTRYVVYHCRSCKQDVRDMA